MKKFAFLMFMMCLSSVLLGCTTVRIEASPDQVTIEHYFGALYVSVADAGQSRVAQVRSLGITTTPLGFTAGYTHQTIIQIPPEDCHLVLWVSSAAQLSEARRLVADVPKACVVSDFSSTKGD